MLTPPQSEGIDLRASWNLRSDLSLRVRAGDYWDRRRAEGDKWGVRVIVSADDSVLLVQHDDPSAGNRYWVFPGGGVELGERIAAAGEREVEEETGLRVAVGSLIYVREFGSGDVEFYVLGRFLGGQVVLGYDPELPPDRQVLTKADFMPIATLQDMQRVVLYPRTVQRRLAADLVSGWPSCLYLGAAE